MMTDEELVNIEYELSTGLTTLRERYYAEYIEENTEKLFQHVDVITLEVDIDLFGDLKRLFDFKYKEAQANLWKLKEERGTDVY